jgi:hypothetical protein
MDGYGIGTSSATTHPRHYVRGVRPTDRLILGLLAEQAGTFFAAGIRCSGASSSSGDVFAAGPFELRRLAPGKRSLLREMLSMLRN